ncbi:MAG: hypothetical protein ABSD98_14265 [Candidatus Korobacteraceae bacterium]|jgi:hypothetical protein
MDKLFTGVTLHGLPVRIELQWPFHRSEGGSDWYVVHGTLRLNDGGPLHADVALNLAQTIREVLPSLDGDLAFWVAVNTARKTLDDKDLELLKSGKRQPVAMSSRCYSIRHQHFTFVTATPEQVEEFVARKVFWESGPGAAASPLLARGGEGSERQPVLIADPCDAQYLGAADPNMVDRLVAAAKDLAARGMIELAGDYARASDGLLARRDEFVAAKDHALEELHLKHAFERA